LGGRRRVMIERMVWMLGNRLAKKLRNERPRKRWYYPP